MTRVQLRPMVQQGVQGQSFSSMSSIGTPFQSTQAFNQVPFIQTTIPNQLLNSSIGNFQGFQSSGINQQTIQPWAIAQQAQQGNVYAQAYAQQVAQQVAQANTLLQQQALQQQALQQQAIQQQIALQQAALQQSGFINQMGQNQNQNQNGQGISMIQTNLVQPRVEIAETNSEVVLSCELPYADPNNLNLSVSEDSVSIQAFSSQGTYNRTVSLPTDVRAESTEATFTNGVLEVRLPKVNQARRKVNINVNQQI